MVSGHGIGSDRENWTGIWTFRRDRERRWSEEVPAEGQSVPKGW